MSLTEARRMVAEDDLRQKRAELARWQEALSEHPQRTDCHPDSPWRDSSERRCLVGICNAIQTQIACLEATLSSASQEGDPLTL